MKNTWKRLLSVMLAVAMVLGTVTVPAMADEDKAAKHLSFTWEKVDNRKRLLSGTKEIPAAAAQSQHSDKDIVRVSIIFKELPAIRKYSTSGIGDNMAAMAYSAGLRNEQSAINQRISSQALGGKELDIVWNLTLIANMVSANVPFGSIEKIEKVPGVKSVYLETKYEPAVIRKEGEKPNQSTAAGMTGASQVWSEYTGAGSRIAIIDTGLDTDHELFSDAVFQYQLSKLESTVELMDSAEVSSKWSMLHVSKEYEKSKAREAYINSKIPFAFNYVDRDFDVTHDNDSAGEHGSHIAGIAAANRFVKRGDSYISALDEVLTQGVAPDAQLLIMKVFGKNGGAYDSDYMVAIEDAIVLGADSVNLSLGTEFPGFVMNYNKEYREIMDNLESCDTTVTIAMGNAYDWAAETLYGNLHSEDVNYYTGGSPGSYANAFTVASVDNIGKTELSIVCGTNRLNFSEPLGYSNKPIITLAGEQEYVYIDSVGSFEQFEAAASLINGKIAICNRGTTSFAEKANAAAVNGAIGVIIVNDQDGVVNMDLSAYEYEVPVVSVLKSAQAVLSVGDASSLTVGETTAHYYTGTLLIEDQPVVSITDPGYYTMSDFSSWGVPGDLSLKPEITAPGGGIYSVDGSKPGGKSYETMSGTSMATPQVAGMAALVAQYIRENDLVSKTGKSERFLVQSLLMSTSEPLFDENGNYYSVLKQGAGLARVDSAVSTRSYIEMDEGATKSASDGKVKVELGDDPGREGEYSFKFTINNFSEEEVTYELSADFFTQAFDEDRILRLRDTAPLISEITYVIGGETYFADNDVNASFDCDGDGKYSVNDAQAILDYVVKGNELAGSTLADLDGDGEITTYDAYLILSYLNSAAVTVPAGSSKEIEVIIYLYDIDEYDILGNYVEGYVYATARPTSSEKAEGVKAHEVHSIPIIGYYGSWLEPSMFDTGYYMPNGLGDFIPMNIFAGFYYTPAGESDYYPFKGNPIIPDDTYLPERDSFSPAAIFSLVNYTAIRNYAIDRIIVNRYDEENNCTKLLQMLNGMGFSAYYSLTWGVFWNRAVNDFYNIDFSYALENGDTIELCMDLAPEYYVDINDYDDYDYICSDWDAIDELENYKSSMYQTSTVDGIAPEFISAEPVVDEEGNLTEINVTASDNRYVAAVAIADEYFINSGEGFFGTAGSDPNAEEGETGVFTIGDVDTESAHFVVQIYDYAANVTTYKLNLKWEEERNDEVRVVLSDEEITILNQFGHQLSAAVYPWGVDESVIWSSSSEAITVSEDGFVQNVSGNDGDTATITATSVSYPDRYASCVVNVRIIEKELNGILRDENGEIWFSKYDVANLPFYERLHSESLDAEIISACYDTNRTLYAASVDTLYTVDEETWTLTEVCKPEAELFDFCAAPNLGEDYFLAPYFTNVLVIDKNNGKIVGSFDFNEVLGEYSFVGIAYLFQIDDFDESDDNGYYDVIALIDREGYLYFDAFGCDDEGFFDVGFDKITQMGEKVNSIDCQSLYYDGKYIYWNRYDTENKCTEVIAYSIKNSESYNLGSFAENVWPVSGVFEAGKLPFDDTVSQEPLSLPLINEPRRAKPADSIAKSSETRMPSGKLNSAVIERREKNEDFETVTIKLTVDADSNNGLITLTYDENLTFVAESIASTVELSSVLVDEEARTVTVGYASLVEIAEGDTVATVKFTKNNDNEATVSATTEELNDRLEAADPEIIIIPVAVTGVTLKESATVVIGESVTLTAEISPESAANKNVMWSSSDESIAAVDEGGKVTGVSEGTATITVTTVDGKYTAECVVTVKSKITPTPAPPVNPENPDGAKKFVDVTDEKACYYDAVYWAVDKGITKGKDATHFAPLDDCTRAQIVIFLYRAMGEPEVTATENPFEDVKAGSYYEKAVLWAVANGVTKGKTSNTFAPDDTCTRAQIVTFLYRAMGEPEVTSAENPFEDVKAGSYYEKAVLWAVEQGITKGKTATAFAPDANCTRAQAVTFLYRALAE